MEVKLDLKNLDKYTKRMKADLDKHYAKVGVLSAKNNRDNDDDSGMTNAKLAAVHEFGSRDGRIPERSFFRLTYEERGEDMSAFIESNELAILKKVMSGKTKDVYKQLGAKWVSFINECFETEGFGKWAPLSEATLEARLAKTPTGLRYNKKTDEMVQSRAQEFNPKILQDTGQLERSIMYEVV